MSKLYMCVVRSATGGCEEPSPAQMDEAFAKFQAWQETFADNIADMGGRLGEGKVLSKDGIVDGPFMEAKEIVGGYMMVKADDIDEAMRVVEACPPVAASLGSSTVEVREIMRM